MPVAIFEGGVRLSTSHSATMALDVAMDGAIKCANSAALVGTGSHAIASDDPHDPTRPRGGRGRPRKEYCTVGRGGGATEAWRGECTASLECPVKDR